MHATASCGLSLYAGCPVLQSWYLLGLRHGVCSNRKRALNRGQGMADFYLRQKIVKRKAVPITDDARASFCLAFNITPAQQICLEQMMDNSVCGTGIMLRKDFISNLSCLLTK